MRHFLIILTLICSYSLFAQVGDRNSQDSLTNTASFLSDAEFKEVSNKYVYRETKTVWRLKENKSEGKHLKGPRWSLGLASSIQWLFSLIGYIILGGIVILLIYKLIPKNNTKKRNTEKINLDHIDKIEEIDFDLLLENAISSGDFRLAFRIRFLIVIQYLTRKKAINYKPYKTNRAYTRELSKSKYQSDFRQVANVFERVWYGEQELSEAEYNQLLRYFETIKDESIHEHLA